MFIRENTVSIVSSVCVFLCDLINCYLCRIQITEIIKIFIKESKMVNNSKLQLMYLMVLLGLSIAQVNFFLTLLLLNQKYLQMQP